MAESKKKGKLNARKITAGLRAMDIASLEKKLVEEQEKLMQDRFRHATAALEDTALLKTTRRQIARIETVINEKKMAEEKKLKAAGVENPRNVLEKQANLDTSTKEKEELKEGAPA